MLTDYIASKTKPSFKQDSKWDRLHFDLSGCKLSISLPPQDWDFEEEPHKEQFDLFNPQLFDYQDKPDRNGYGPWMEGVASNAIFKRNWKSYKSLGFYQSGTLQCSAVPIDVSRMPTSPNCFSPNQMEKLIHHDLYYTVGPGFNGNHYKAPLNWKVINLGENKCVYTEAWRTTPPWEKNNPYDQSTFRANVWIPLYENKYVLITFSVTGSLPADQSNLLMLNRIDKIILSTALELSSEAMSQKITYEENNFDETYSEKMEEAKWKYYGSYEQTWEGTQIHGPCSPPPKLN